MAGGPVAGQRPRRPPVRRRAGWIRRPPDDVDAWAEALAELHEDRARLTSMGQAAAAYARERNSPAANVRVREAVYESVLR